MVQTLGTVAEFGEFVDEDILTSFVQTIEYVLRIEKVMTTFNNNEDLREDFVSALGNLMKQSSQLAYIYEELAKYPENSQPTIIWNFESRRLQDEETDEERPLTPEEKLEEIRKLIKKIVVIKNEHLDQLCRQQDRTSYLGIITDQLEVLIHYVSKDDAQNFINRRTNSIFRSENGNAEVTVPTYQLFDLSESLENWNEVNWMCIQTSFMLANPVAGFTTSDQYYHKD